jgi:hypothetical protein
MLKTTSSVVLALLKTSTYRKKVRLGLSLAAALLAGRFEHPEIEKQVLTSFPSSNTWSFVIS